MTTRSPQAVWETALGQLELQVTPANYQTWLRDTVGLRYADGVFAIGAPSVFATEWLTARLRPLITATLARLLQRQVAVTFEILRPTPAADPPSLPAEPAAAVPSSSGLPQPRLTFESFTVGEENRLAYTAALAAADPEALSCNPIVLYGPSGLGKTHLLHAIAHAASRAGRAPLLVCSERFLNEFRAALESRTMPQFRARYRCCRLFLLDDLQFLETKVETQEEFFHTFNELYAQGSQIVVTCDRPPARIAGLSERLRSRLHSGLLAELQPPSLDTRLAILRAKATAMSLPLPDDILLVVANQLPRNVRDLEGGLHRILAFGSLVREPLTVELARRALQPFVPVATSGPSPQEVIRAVSHHFGLQPHDLTGPSRNRRISYARHIAIYLLRHDTHQPLHAIGQLVGGRDHSTILQACRRIDREARALSQTQADLLSLRAALACTAA